MIAVDTNLLIYAHRQDAEWHPEALGTLKRLAGGPRRWAIPWPCVHEFISITTHPSIYVPPSPLPLALEAIRVWLSCPSCRAIGEGPDHLSVLESLALKGKVRGPVIHDARIVAICLENGVTELWSADRDLTRFRELRVVNPLVGHASRL